MWKTVMLLFCGALLANTADDPWAKVKAIKSGNELRVYKKGSTQPLLVKMDDATDERLLVVNKNEQTSIAKEDIDRIDARPTNKRAVTKEVKETTGDSNSDPRIGLGSEDLFLDVAHLNPRGNELIATLLAVPVLGSAATAAFALPPMRPFSPQYCVGSPNRSNLSLPKDSE